jgi:hypothetical protein
MGEIRNAYRVLAENPKGKRRPGRPRRRWENNIKMDFKGTGHEYIELILMVETRNQ